MKSILEADRQEILERALMVIEGLTYLSIESNPKILDEIYTISHVALGLCCNKKDDLLGIEILEQNLKELKIYDVDKDFLKLREKHGLS